MLSELRIKNLAIIDEVSLTFSKGFNVLTGETGAGKSIILNAVRLLLGERMGEEVIRTSEEEAVVEALFDLSGNREVREKVKEWAPKTQGHRDETECLIRRVLSRSGRSRAFLNESLTTLGTLSEVGEALITLCGQHEHQSLQRVETHLDLLDEFGGLIPLRNQYQEHFENLLSMEREIRRVWEEKERGNRDRELMMFQLGEIEAARLERGEEEGLREERKILTHARKLIDFVTRSLEGLQEGEGSAVERIQRVLRQGPELIGIDPSLSDPLRSLESVSIQLEEVCLTLRDYLRRVEADPQRLEEVENRLEEIDRLKRKYGPTIEDVLSFKERLRASLGALSSSEERLSHLEGIRDSLRGEVVALANKLSFERKRVATELKKAVERELGLLGMKRASFEVRVEEEELTPKGGNRVEFMISPNVGEEVKPLAKIASGGELSRMMLAMKKILARVGGRQVLVFDEVDSGIGGAVAEVVGRSLKELSKHHQVICVTHLPQIACFADAHFSVRKAVRGNRTITLVEQLEREAVVDEIARMLGGVKVTEKTKAHAREMIQNARRG
ncbi:MAG: DNA repair protein RecN [Desulfobacterota bacterium]|nr:DNA repair protein RecN [Thermodesulfobacteriota bacterium]